MDKVFESIDKICDLQVLHYSRTSEGHEYFYLLEQSALQVLRILPSDTPIEVKHIFADRQRISQQIENIKSAKTTKDFLDLAIPLVENGNFHCTDLTVIVDSQIELMSHDDGEVHLISGNEIQLRDLLIRILTFQGYSPGLLVEIINLPNLYHRLVRTDRILSSYRRFDELIDSF